MATYTVSGHPLNTPLTIPGANAELVRVALQEHGVGTSVTIVLTGPEDTTVKGHGALR